jgi:hypothetical protein
MIRAAAFVLSLSALAAGMREEQLRYQVNWPSGLGLGEAQLRAARDGSDWKLEFQIEASVPGFKVLDQYRSRTSEKLCAAEFEKEFEHGPRKGKEKTTFEAGIAKRVTANGGGKSEFPVGACARDAVAFLFYVRDEVSRGRLPAAQKMYFGGAYDVRVQFVSAERVKVSEEMMEADRLKVTVAGSASKLEFELFLARDETRTPVLVRVPFAMGTFSMEWMR